MPSTKTIVTGVILGLVAIALYNKVLPASVKSLIA